MKNFLPIIILFLFSCGNNPVEKKESVEETAVKGNISVAVDESFKNIFDEEATIFQTNYPEAKINLIAESEAKAVQDLMDKKVRMAVISRKLTDDEIKYCKHNELDPRHFLSCYDAVILMVNQENADSLLTQSQMEKIMRGEFQNWNSIDAKNSSGEIVIVFDDNGSSAARYFKEKFAMKELPKNCFAVHNSIELMNYVSAHSNAIGIAGYNLLNTDEAEQSKIFSLVSIQDDSTKKFYSPTLKNIRWGFYPYRREVYIACAEAYPGLGTGFANFVLSDVGQTIVNRAGLIPAKQLLRMIEVKKEF